MRENKNMNWPWNPAPLEEEEFDENAPLQDIELAAWPRREPTVPQERRQQRKEDRKYRVRYDLAYEGGGYGEWDGYYRTMLGARIAIFWNRHISSYGGTAVLYI